jgi:hypothetical protein
MKKKGSNPILKFTIIIIFIAIAGFLIFYTIDNPSFWKEQFSTILSDEENEEMVSSPDDTEAEPEEIPEDENESLSIWQRIIDFFRRDGGNEDGEESYPGALELNFYFSSLEEEKKLVSEKRTIIAGDPETAVRNAIEALLKGPEKPYHFSVIPAGTKLIDVEVSKNIAEIDLSQDFLEESLDSRILDEYVIYSIVNTLTEIHEIDGVIFYIEGVRIKVYGDIDLSIPAIRNKEFLEEE